jgi:DNA/RNA-binding domain of Phe-tRNA-synthetase-like protein
MKSGYLYLDEAEMLLIKNLLQKNKDEDSKNLSLKLESYRDTYWDLKNKNFINYRNLAIEKFKNISSDLVSNEEVSVDDDALVASSKNGAFVHCWVWVENSVKPKRTRKKTV